VAGGRHTEGHRQLQRVGSREREMEGGSSEGLWRETE